MDEIVDLKNGIIPDDAKPHEFAEIKRPFSFMDEINFGSPKAAPVK